MSKPAPPEGMSLEQQLAYARDLRRVYDAERARRRELETANQALAEANAELDRRLYDLIAAQDWVLAVNSSRELPALMEALAQPLVVLLQATDVVVFPWLPDGEQLGPALGHGIRAETPELAALRTSALSAAVLAAAAPWEVADLTPPRSSPPPTAEDSGGAATEQAALGVDEYAVARALGWGALVAWPLVARGERVGLLYVAWETPHAPDERERMLLDLLAQHAAVSLLNAQVLTESSGRAAALQRAEQQQLAYARDLRRAYDAERARRAEVHAAYLTTVKVLAAAIETRDVYTGGHVDRVATFSVATGRELGWASAQLEALELGALLHDVGKIGVADRVLRKPGRLDPDETAQMRLHPEIGARMLQAVAFLRTSAGCALRHHERYDGQGYPGGLAGEAIPPEARIIAVTDTFDAMTTDRPYRQGLPTSAALAEIERCTGTQFDPLVVAAFFRAVQTGAIAVHSGA